jgi:pantoate--beta-alanine ligase
MMVTGDISMVRSHRWLNPGLEWGLVPTMGYLHEGHLSLVRSARSQNERVAVSIFVNPTQFMPGEDLKTYPTNMQRDLELLKHENADLIFMPENAVMYPAGFQTAISVDDVSQPLEGSSRPTHFRGVATVVAKLLNIVEPTRIYFGQKDAQQTIVIKRMVEDLNFNCEIIICPIVRESDGLAMSSRNIRLFKDQRRAATSLYKALSAASKLFRNGQYDASILRKLMIYTISQEPLAKIDYVSVADPLSLEELVFINDGALFSVAVFFGDVRLIDNMLVRPQFNESD